MTRRWRYFDDPLHEGDWSRRIEAVCMALNAQFAPFAVRIETVDDVQTWHLPSGEVVDLDHSTGTVRGLFEGAVRVRIDFAEPTTVLEKLRSRRVSVDAPVDGRAA